MSYNITSISENVKCFFELSEFLFTFLHRGQDYKVCVLNGEKYLCRKYSSLYPVIFIVTAPVIVVSYLLIKLLLEDV